MNILVCIDFSDLTNVVINEALVIARAMSAKLWLMHVAEPEPDFVGYECGPQFIREQLAEEFRDEHQQLQKEADCIRDAGVDVSAILVQGATVQMILDESRKLESSMIVMGSHGRGTMHNLLVGSVSEGVIRKAECPVLIVPTRKK